MKDYDFQGIIKAISDASPSHLALVSFLVLPVILNYWLQTLIKIFPEITICWKIISVVFLLAIYVFCIIWLTKENNERKERELIRDKILGRLYGNDWKSMSFESAKKVLGDRITDERIAQVIETYPTTLRAVRMKKKENGNTIQDSEENPIYIAGVGLVRINDDEA